MLGLRPLSVAGVAFLLGRVHAGSDGYFRGDGTAYTLGDVSAGNCNMMTANSDAGDNYAAINDPQWSGMKNCGRCAEVSCDDDRCASKSISQVVQILDRCPECKYGDLDLSPSVFTKITGSGPARLKVKWKFVDCPVQGNIKYCLKGGSNNFWTAIQPANVVSGVANMKVNGQSTTMVTSAYYYLLDGNSQVQTDLSSVKVTLTSVNGETIQDTVSLTSGSCTTGSSQFSRGASASGNSDQADAVQETPATSAPTATTAAPTPESTPPPTTAAPTPEPTPPPTTAAPTPEPTPPPTTVAPTPESTPSPTPASTPEPTSTPSVEVSDAILGANDERSYSPTPETIVTPSPSPTPTPDTPEPNIATPSPSSTPGVTPTPDVTRLPTPTSQKENISNASLQDDRVAGESTNTPVPTTKPKSIPQPASTSATPIPTTATPPSTPSGETVQNVNNKADTGSGSGTDPLIIGMSALAAVGVFALIVVVVVVRRKRIQEKKRRDDEPVVLSSVLTRSFSGLKTPGDRTDIAMLRALWMQILRAWLLIASTVLSMAGSVREVVIPADSAGYFVEDDTAAATATLSSSRYNRDALTSRRRPAFYFIGDSITEQAGDPSNSGWAALLQHKYVRSVDIINRGLSGYNTRWFVQEALPVFEKELQTQYAPSLVTLFFGANDAALATGPAAGQHVPLDEYRTNLAHIIHTLTPHLPPQAKILLITPPAIIDAARSGGDRSNEAAGEYARACVDVARAEDVPVLDLHTFFNTQFRREAQRATFFSDGLHLSPKGNTLLAELLEVTIKEIFDDVELERFRSRELPDWRTFV